MADLTVGTLKALLTLDAAQFARQMQTVERQLSQAGKKFTAVGKQLTTKITLPLAAVGGAMSKLAADFSSEMTKIETLVGVQPELVNQWRKSLLGMAPAVGRGPGELARALFIVTSAGIRGAGALGVLENAAKASASGLGDTADIARTVTSAVQAWTKQGLKAKRATEVLVATVREGNLEAASLAGSLGRVLGVAAQAGLTFEQVGGFIATLTRLGVSSEEAVTALRSAITGFLKPGKDAEKILAQYGLTAAKIREQIGEKGLARTLVDLVALFEGNEEAIARVIPNVRALAGVLGTAAAQSEAFLAIEKSIIDSTGILDEAFERARREASFFFDQMKAAVSAAAIRIGTELLPKLSALFEKVTELAKAMAGADKQTIAWTISLGGLAIAIGPIALAAGVIMQLLAKLGPAFRTTGRLIGGAIGVLTRLSAVLAAVALSIAAVGIAAGAVFGQTPTDLRNWVAEWGRFGTIVEKSVHAGVSALLRFSRFMVEWVQSIGFLMDMFRAWFVGAIADSVAEALRVLSGFIPGFEDKLLEMRTAVMDFRESIAAPIPAFGGTLTWIDEAIKREEEAHRRRLGLIQQQGADTANAITTAAEVAAKAAAVGADSVSKSMLILTDEMKDARKEIGEVLKGLALDLQTAGMEPAAAETERLIEQVRALGIAGGVTAEQLAPLLEHVRAYRKEIVAASKETERVGINVGQSIASGMREFTTGILRGTREFEDAMLVVRDIGIRVMGDMFEQILLKKLHFEDLFLDNAKSFGAQLKKAWSAIWDSIVAAAEWAFNQIRGQQQAAAAASTGAAGAAAGARGGWASATAAGALMIPMFLQHGALVTQPTLAVIGEKQPEAVIPLSRISDFAGGTNALNVQVVNYSQEPIRVREARGPDGRRQAQILVGSAGAEDIEQNGPLARSMQRTYGLSRRGVVR